MKDRTIHIAFLGPKGSYSHIASKQYANINHFNNIIEYSFQNFNEIITFIKNEKEKYGIFPIENSTSGSINEVYDLLQTTHIFLIGEIHIPITHCILAIPNTSLKNIKTLYTHPQPFQQCSQFLNKFPKWNTIFCNSSADAMKTVSTLKHPNFAALGNAQSGKYLYGLQTLKRNLANKKNNITRFIILSNKRQKINKNTPIKITLSLSIKYQPDIFVKISLILNSYNLTIQHLKLRPIKNKKHKQTLFIDIKTHLYNQEIQTALNQLHHFIPSLKILGYYQPKTNPITEPITFN